MMILCGGGAFNIGDTDETGHTGTKKFFMRVDFPLATTTK